jgi:hypothetical protein
LEEQARTHDWQINAKLQVAQHHDEFAGEQAAIDAQLTELLRRRTSLGTERAATIEFPKA